MGLVAKRLPFVSSNSAIRYFRHAVSLDERRAKFKANLYNRPTEEEAKLGVQRGEMPKSGVDAKAGMTEVLQEWIDKTKNGAQREEQKQMQHEQEFSQSEPDACDTDTLEVWFAGCHCGMSFKSSRAIYIMNVHWLIHCVFHRRRRRFCPGRNSTQLG